MVTLTINLRMFHRFLTNMVVIMLLHTVCKTMLLHHSRDKLRRIKAEVGTNLVEPVGDSHQILTRCSSHEEVTTTVTTEEEEGILVVTINANNNNNIGMVVRSIITSEEGIVVSIIVSKVVTATVEEVGVIIIIMIKALDIGIKAYWLVVCIIRVEPVLGSLV